MWQNLFLLFRFLDFQCLCIRLFCTSFTMFPFLYPKYDYCLHTHTKISKTTLQKKKSEFFFCSQSACSITNAVVVKVKLCVWDYGHRPSSQQLLLEAVHLLSESDVFQGRSPYFSTRMQVIIMHQAIKMETQWQKCNIFLFSFLQPNV